MRHLIIIFLFMISANVSAGIKLSYSLANIKNISTQQKKNIEKFLLAAYEKTPKMIRDEINLNINLEFKALKGIQDLEDACSGDKNIILGTIKRKSLQKGKGSIILSTLFLDTVINANKEIKVSRCPNLSFAHDTIYGVALGTYLHELAHLIDPFLPRVLKTRGFHVEEDSSKPLRFSNSLAFRSLVNFKDHGVSKNTDSYSDINRHEFSNSQESFAINFELALLDKNFPCRRPHIFSYFKDVFNLKNEIKCSNHHLILKASSGDIDLIDTHQIIAADYLYATEGVGQGSQYGHSMIRLILCAEGENERECRINTSDDLVLSYRGDVGDSINPLSGLTGKYKMRLFIYDFDQVIHDYTFDEFREIRSYPLSMSSVELNNLVKRSISDHWEFVGKYYFISRNCATETLFLINSALEASSNRVRFTSERKPITPNGVLKNLIKNEIINPSLFNENGIKGYIYPSALDRFQMELVTESELSSLIKKFDLATAQEIISNLEFYVAKSTQTIGNKDEVKKAFNLLNWLRARVRVARENLIINRIVENSLSAENVLISKIKNLEGNLRPSQLIEGRYGIPFDEFENIEKKHQTTKHILLTNYAKLEVTLNSTETIIDDMLDQLEQVRKNIVAYLIASNRS